MRWEFPDGPVVRTLRFHCRGCGFNPSQGTKIPQAAWCSQKQKKIEEEGILCPRQSQTQLCLPAEDSCPSAASVVSSLVGTYAQLRKNRKIK